MKKIKEIEILRGFCALMVFIHHAIIFSDVLVKDFIFRKSILPYTPSGHLMVLLFFILSGYVMGINYPPSKSFNPLQYLKKRFVRLYPIYLIAILLPALFFAEELKSVIGTAFFVQNIYCKNLVHNNPLWSLNHEMVYYLLLIPILLLKLKPRVVLIILAIILLISALIFPMPAILEAYTVGFLFWITGYQIALYSFKHSEGKESYSIEHSEMLAGFFLLLACDFLNSFGVVFAKVHLLHSQSRMGLDDIVNVRDFSLFPFALFAAFLFANIRNKAYRLLKYGCFLISWLHLLILVKNGSFFKVQFFTLPTIFLLISTALLFFKNIRFNKLIKLMIWIGSVSYALYVLHMPIMYFVGEYIHVKAFSNPFVNYIMAFFITGVIVFILSYFLERKLQPIIRNIFIDKPQLMING